MQQLDFMTYKVVSHGIRWLKDRSVLAKVATGIVAGRMAIAVRLASLGCFASLFLFTGISAAGAGEVDVIAVKAHGDGDGGWTISATLRHEDSGWDHYADRWEAVGADGKVLAVRKLAHPHVNEQPFTRSLSGVVIPVGITVVTIRAHDSVHGYGGKELKLRLDE